ncbi:MAG: sigma-70 family RNA polymerase sigma factor [Candidatus Pacebacteria bacterium]|nr:sigma-70 family RNA polymerase sigma factor [Candidatus Paceibacterota bacterium]
MNAHNNDRLKEEFTTVYNTYADTMFRYCFFKTSDREAAKDLVQQIFLKTWSYLQKGEIDNYRPFLYRVATRIVIDWYRRIKTDSLDTLRENGYDPEDKRANTSQTAEVNWVFTVMEHLKEEDQNLIIWRYVEDLSPSEIASILGETENVVSVRLHRAKAKLEQLLNRDKT